MLIALLLIMFLLFLIVSTLLLLSSYKLLSKTLVVVSSFISLSVSAVAENFSVWTEKFDKAGGSVAFVRNATFVLFF